MEMNGKYNKCLLCKRMPLNEIMLHVYSIFESEDDNLVRKFGLKVSELIADSYLKDRPALCGRAPKGIVAAAIWIVCIQNDITITKKSISEEMNVCTKTITDTSRIICKILDLKIFESRKKIRRARLYEYIMPEALSNLFSFAPVKKPRIVRKSHIKGPIGTCDTCGNLPELKYWKWTDLAGTIKKCPHQVYCEIFLTLAVPKRFSRERVCPSYIQNKERAQKILTEAKEIRDRNFKLYPRPWKKIRRVLQEAVLE